MLQIISRHLSIPKKCFYGNKSSYLPFDTMWLFLYFERSSSGKGIEVIALCRTWDALRYRIIIVHLVPFAFVISKL
jgi:hypothetical protein